MRKGPQGQQQVLCLFPIPKYLSLSSLPGAGGDGHRRPWLLGRRDLSLFDETCNTTRGQGDISDEPIIPNLYFNDVNPSSGNGPWRHTVGLTWHLWSTDEGTWIFIRWTLLRHHETPILFTTSVKAPWILPIHCSWKNVLSLFPSAPGFSLFIHLQYQSALQASQSPYSFCQSIQLHTTSENPFLYFSQFPARSKWSVLNYLVFV